MGDPQTTVREACVITIAYDIEGAGSAAFYLVGSPLEDCTEEIATKIEHNQNGTCTIDKHGTLHFDAKDPSSQEPMSVFEKAVNEIRKDAARQQYVDNDPNADKLAVEQTVNDCRDQWRVNIHYIEKVHEKERTCEIISDVESPPDHGYHLASAVSNDRGFLKKIQDRVYEYIEEHNTLKISEKRPQEQLPLELAEDFHNVGDGTHKSGKYQVDIRPFELEIQLSNKEIVRLNHHDVLDMAVNEVVLELGARAGKFTERESLSMDESISKDEVMWR